MPLPDITLALGSPQPIRLMGRGFTVKEARELVEELNAVADLADKRAARDLDMRIEFEEKDFVVGEG